MRTSPAVIVVTGMPMGADILVYKDQAKARWPFFARRITRFFPTQNVRVKSSGTRVLHASGQLAKNPGEAKTSEAEGAKKS
jgi:hypothetical protein